MFCASCGSELPGNGGACVKCGMAFSAGPGGAAASMPMASGVSGLTDNVAGALAYVTVIPAIIFLVSEDYNKRTFVRFHAFQSIFLAVACTVLLLCLAMIPVIGWILEPLCLLAFLGLWLVTVFKAYGGKEFALPVIGDLAHKQANPR